MPTTIYKEITKNTMAKLILYQAKSPYPGDVTKNCALTGKEVDNNFLNLKGEDIEKIYLDEETKKLTFTRFKDGLKNCNGETINAEIEIDLTKLEYVTGYKYEDGVIKITYSNGKTAEMPVEAFGMAVATDHTISGNGTKAKPLSISQAMRTGQYQPVNGFVNLADGEQLPKDAANGEGYVTKEIKSDFGLFYTSDQALLLEGLLRMESSEWRVPRKKDWDTLLNYLEECDKYKNHALRSETDLDARGMNLGNLAGFKAKSLDNPEADYWKRSGENNGDVLRIYPTGSFSALTGAYSGFGNFAQFWSLTEGDVSCRNFYSKKFVDCIGTVTQVEEMPATKLTIRLVKDFLGDNYRQFEEIHGRMYETKLFASDSEECNQVWTMVNIDITDYDHDLVPTPMPEDATTAITTDYAYYINRWDGSKWDKHEMVEGDCVVILPSGNCESVAEYRLECGELVNKDAFWQDQLDNLSAITEDLQSQIDAEVSARTEADEHLQEQIDELSGTTDYILETIGSGFTPEHSITEVVGDGLSGITLTDAIIQLQEDLIETAETLYNMITAETQAREEADDRIKEAVGLDENGDYIPKDGTTYLDSASTIDEEILALDSGLTQEVLDRIAADEKLQEEIDRTEEGVGLDEDGNYIPKSGTTYLDDAESVEGEIDALDKGLDSAQKEIDRAEGAVGLDEDGNYIQKENTNYLDSATTIEEEIAALDEEAGRHSGETDNIESSIGLDEDGNYIPKSGTTYLDDAETVEGEIDALDKGLAQEVEDRKEADLEIWNGIGTPNDIPVSAGAVYSEKFANGEITMDDFKSGNVTVFEIMNACNDYGYNLDEDGD